MNSEEGITIDTRVLDFLLAEYSRFAELQKELRDQYYKRFDIYLAIFTASVAGTVAVLLTDSPIDKLLIIVAILGFLLFVGVMIFASLSSANVSSLIHEEGLRNIRQYFYSHSPQISQILASYTDRTKYRGTKSSYLIIRGLVRTTPKSILVIFNSLLIATLVYFFIHQNIVSTRLSGPNWYILISIFLTGVILHFIYSILIYRINGV